MTITYDSCDKFAIIALIGNLVWSQNSKQPSCKQLVGALPAVTSDSLQHCVEHRHAVKRARQAHAHRQPIRESCTIPRLPES